MTARRLLTQTLVITGWWSAWGLVNIINIGQMWEASGAAAPWSHLFATELFSSLLWVPITLGALWLASRWPLGRIGFRSVTAHLLGLAATIVGRAAVVMIFNNSIRWYPDQPPPVDELLLISVYNNLFMYGLITIGAHAFYYARAHREREAQLARAELTALRTQIQPHFLFNTLNTIAALVPEEPDAAEHMIAGLGALLRRSLDSDGRTLVPLSEELDLLRSYLDIEQVRFADRLSITWDVDPATLPAAVPPLILQPLAENAIRHGLWPRQSPGSLSVHARRAGSRLILEIADDGIGLPSGPIPTPAAPIGAEPNPRGKRLSAAAPIGAEQGPHRNALPAAAPMGAEQSSRGIGLANTAARLRQLFGPRQEFRLESQIGGGVLATVEVPWRVLTAEVAQNDPHLARRR